MIRQGFKDGMKEGGDKAAADAQPGVQVPPQQVSSPSPASKTTIDVEAREKT